MKELAPRSPETRSETLRTLAREYAGRHKAMENYIAAWFVTFGLLRRLDIDPLTWKGRLGNFIVVMAVLLGAPMAATAATGQWSRAPFGVWAIVAVVFAVLGVVIYHPFQDAIDVFLSLHRVMADESGLRRLIAWDQRWFNVRAAVPAAGTFATSMLVFLFIVRQQAAHAHIPAGTIVLGAMLLYQVGEITYTVLMLGIEAGMLTDYDYELYRLSPIDSVALQQSIRGSNRIALLVGLVVTIFIIGFAILLPVQSDLGRRIALVLLVMAYLATGFGVILPRLAMKRIVQMEKVREMAPLQRRLDHLSAQLRELTDAEYEEIQRLKEIHDVIRDSSENVLPVSTIGQLVSSLILPTIAFAAAVAGEVMLSGLFERFLP